MDLITFHSLTQAQTAQHRLRSENIHTELRKAPRSLAMRGCGYALAIRDGEGSHASELLRMGKLPYSQLVVSFADGNREVAH